MRLRDPVNDSVGHDNTLAFILKGAPLGVNSSRYQENIGREDNIVMLLENKKKLQFMYIAFLNTPIKKLKDP